MPLSIIARRYSAYGGGFTDGRIVRFTPNGLSVILRQRSISARSASGDGCVSAVRMPRPPALDTAAASSARPTHIMPPCTIGYSIPTSSEKRVFSFIQVSLRHLLSIGGINRFSRRWVSPVSVLHVHG